MSKERRQQNGVLLIVVCQSYRKRDISESGYWTDSGQRREKAVMCLHQENKDRSKKIPRFHKLHVRTSFILSAQDLKLSYGTFQRRNLLFCLFSLPTLSSLGSSKPPLKGEQTQGRKHSEQWGEDISHTTASSYFRLKLEKGRKIKSALPGGLWTTIGFLNFSFGDCFRIW